MIDESLFDDFWSQFENIKNVAEESNNRITGENIDPLFDDYANVFIKSYFVSSCFVLECFIQELVFCYVKIFQQKIMENDIPNNLMCWSIMRDKADSDKFLKFDKLEISISKKEIEEKCSANVYRTISLFKMVGVDISENEQLNLIKPQIGSKIEKRNNIAHHNDDASDLSFTDIIETVDLFVSYSRLLVEIVSQSSHLR